MASTRFSLDPDRVFPDHAYAPGYEPTQPEPEPRVEVPIGADLIGFVAAAGLMTGALALVSLVLLWF